jgi:serine/threonine protein kinase/formylglycine-generating enzyme required for sulfatase activity
MATTHADTNLVFAILALQMEFLRREQLVAGFQVWVHNKTQPLGKVLQEQGALSEPQLGLLLALVEYQLAAHDGDVARTLASLGAPKSLLQELEQIDDPDVQASLTWLGSGDSTVEEAPPTKAGPPGKKLFSFPWQMARAPSSSGQRFRILQFHKQGGLGEVFVAEDTELHREVALKTLKACFSGDPVNRARFLLEAEITGRLEHPGIVPVYGLTVGPDGRPFYAMRFIKGETLLEAIQRFHQAEGTGRTPGERTLALRDLLTRFIATCNALAYAHDRGILHRDLKPANILLGPYGETLVVDWGLAKTLGKREESSSETTLHPVMPEDSHPTEWGFIMGTPAYLSPEQAAGQNESLTKASDVYSLGATLYHLLTGQAPFGKGTTTEVLQRVKAGSFLPPRQVNRKVPQGLEAICLKAMALRPEDRYGSARTLAADLEHWLADEPVTALRDGSVSRLGRWIRHHTTLASILVGLVLLVSLTVVFGQYVANRNLRAEQEVQRDKAQNKVDLLCQAKPKDAGQILKGLDLDQPLLEEGLKKVWDEQAPEARGRRMRAGLALLKGKQDKVPIRDELINWMLETIDPEETLLVRDELHERKLGEESLTIRSMWGVVTDTSPKTKDDQRLRAMVVLAKFDPNSSRWEEEGQAQIFFNLLLNASRSDRNKWLEGLSPFKRKLLGPLQNYLRTHKEKGNEETDKFLIAVAEDQLDFLPELLANATPTEFALGRRLLQGLSDKSKITVLLQTALNNEVLRDDMAQEDREKMAKRQAQLAVALWHVGRTDLVWRLLQYDPVKPHTPDPLVRSYLIHLLAELDADPKPLLEQLGKDKELYPGLRRALVLSLGGFELPPDLKKNWETHLLEWYRSDSDPGLHSAIDWLLRHDKEGDQDRRFKGTRRARLDEIDQELKSKSPKGRRWWVDQFGHTMVRFPGPVDFTMGSPTNEVGHEPNEVLRQVKIPRSFALATKGVTDLQFGEFVKAYPNLERILPLRPQDTPKPQRVPGPDAPAWRITWYDAAQYCRWLDDQDKEMKESDKCFPSIIEIEKHKKAKRPLALPENYLTRTGHRLPTSAEFEYACRAGSTTSRFYGSASELLRHSAWYSGNNKGKLWGVGQKKPNDFGLFDVLGNQGQFLLEREGKFRGVPGPIWEDREYQEEINPIPAQFTALERVMTPLTNAVMEKTIRCASRSLDKVYRFSPDTGFRVARTLRNEED